MVVLIIIGLIIWWMVEEGKKKTRDREVAAEEAQRLARRTDPSWVGAELVRLTEGGDPAGLGPAIEQLPNWPVRLPLTQAAEWITALAHSARVAERAGVPAVFVEKVDASVESSRAVIGEVAVRMTSLAMHYGYPGWTQLPDEPRVILEKHGQRLCQLRDAAYALHHSLGLAMAVGDSTDPARADTVGQDLFSLAEAIQQLLKRMWEDPGF